MSRLNRHQSIKQPFHRLTGVDLACSPPWTREPLIPRPQFYTPPSYATAAKCCHPAPSTEPKNITRPPTEVGTSRCSCARQTSRGHPPRSASPVLRRGEVSPSCAKSPAPDTQNISCHGGILAAADNRRHLAVWELQFTPSSTLAWWRRRCPLCMLALV
jgi:hypothetical protein